MTRISGVIVDAMLREAAEAIARSGLGITAEVSPGGRDAIILWLTDAPYTELVLTLEK